MPVYTSNPPCTSIFPGDLATVVSAETLVTGQAYQRVAIGNVYMQGVSQLVMEVEFSADPGAFQIDVQDSATDSDGNYANVPAGGSITTVNAAFKGSVVLSPFVGGFARPFATLQAANAVTCTIRFRR